LIFAGFDGVFGNADDVNLGNVLTDANGNYIYNDLPPGNYRATLNPASVPGLNPTTAVIINETLGVNEVFVDGDFGLQYATSIGDTVYYDVDGNGTQNVGEPGIPNVTVTLKDNAGNDVDSDLSTPGIQPTVVQTNSTGKYAFENLPFGTYQPVVTPPSDHVQTGDPDSTLDNRTVLTTSATTPANLGGDFGYRGTASYGDRVWVDQNNNQIQDSGETTNVQGATITLLFAGYDGVFGNSDDVTYPTATTDANGNYNFTNLPVGNYRSTLDMNSIPGAIQTTPLVINKSLSLGENFQNGDYGVRYTGGIGDAIYFDIDGDGTQDSNEPGIAGVTVTLKDASGNDIDSDPTTTGVQPTTTVTSSTGQYTFADLQFTGYQVVVTPPANFPVQSGDPDTTFNNSSSPTITVANPVNLSQDFGYRGSASLGDNVWYDFDGDGVKDSNEVGIVDVVVSIKWAGPDGIFGNADDLVLGTTTTDANGNYVFANLPAGNYEVSLDSSSVNGTVATTPTTLTQTLTNGQTITNIDFGLRGTGQVGNLVWKDYDKDGVKDTNESGLSGAVVNLYHDINGNGIIDSNDPIIGTTTTDINGEYLFENLINEVASVSSSYNMSYIVSAPTNSGGVLLGSLTPTILGTPNTNNNNQNSTGYALNINPTTNNNLTADSGFIGNASFGDKVWFDVDGDGVQDTNEPPVNGAQVTLIEAGLDGIFGNGDDIVIGSTTTDPNGNYTFTNLIPGNYRATINPGSVNGSVATTPITVDEVLTVGESFVAGDFGLRGAGTIGNLLWIDANMDGIAQSTESGLAGVTVELYQDLNGDGIIQPTEPKISTDVTDSNGAYEFTGLLVEDNTPLNGAGVKYIVRTDNSTLPANTPRTIGGTSGQNNTNQNDSGTVVDLTPTVSTAPWVDFGYLGQPEISIDKTLYEGHDSGVGCPGEEELIIIDKTRAAKNITYCFLVTNTGDTYLDDLTLNDPDLNITDAQMTLLNGTFPLAPGASATWYYQDTTTDSLDNTATVTGIPTNSSGVPTGQSNVSDGDELARLIYVFDPPIGIKTGTYLGANVIRWTMTWINTSQVTANGAIVSDPVPENTTYNGNLECTGEGTTVVVSCNFEGPSA
jgi:protocatechuate 3,4-dioxygenase beta subunit